MEISLICMAIALVGGLMMSRLPRVVGLGAGRG